MENIENPETIPKTHKASKYMLFILSFVFIIAVTGGIYYWQHNKVNSLNIKVSDLQTQLGSSDKSTGATAQKGLASSTFTYTPKTGNLSLTLPKTYGIIVNVDGNKGGAPGATFKVASVTNSNTFSDDAYQGVQVDIDNTFTTLDRAVQVEESILDSQRGAGSTVNRNYKVSDTKVAGLPAKLITADGLDEYEGNVSVYLIGSGNFIYTITVNGTQFSSSDKVMEAILKGASIKPAS